MADIVQDNESERTLSILLQSRGVFNFYVGVEQLVDSLVLALQLLLQVCLQLRKSGAIDGLKVRVEWPHEITGGNTGEQGRIRQYLRYIFEFLLINGKTPAYKLVHPLQEALILNREDRVGKYPH